MKREVRRRASLPGAVFSPGLVFEQYGIGGLVMVAWLLIKGVMGEDNTNHKPALAIS
ncbi:MAG: hypothetical protein HY866_20990 [Chloroflexi bacterium]|nr:hypothetical protein [Chloroflexota bacterium]